MSSKGVFPSKAGTIGDEEYQSDEDNALLIANSTSDSSPPAPPELETVSIHPSQSRTLASVRTSRSSRRRSRAKSGSNVSSPERPPTMNEHPAPNSRVGSPTASIQPAAAESVVDLGLQDDSPKPPAAPPANIAPNGLDQATEFWEAYNRTGDLEDKEFVKSAGGDLDVLLIFAGLFSAIDTAFIIESYKSLKSDPTDEATKLLRSVILILHNSTYDDSTINPPSFTATTRDVRVNAFFFASLCCSLSAAFGAVMAKQWLTQYDQDGGGSLKTPAARGRERHLKYEGRDQWHLEGVITTLPTLLQLSLFFFFVGLSDFILPLNTPVASIIMSFAAATFLFYGVTISISVIDKSSPFQTRLSTLLRRIFSHLRRLYSVLRGSLPSVRLPYRWRARFHDISWQFRYRSGNGSYWARLVSILPYAVKGIGKLLAEELMSLWQGVTSLRAIAEWLVNLYHSTVSFPSRTAHWLCKSWNMPSIASPAQSLESRCVIHLLERMTVPKDLDMLAGVVALLPDGSGAMAIAETLTTFHLRPIAPTFEHQQWLFPGLHGSSSSITMMKILGVTIGKWKCFESNPSAIQSTPVPSLNNQLLRYSLVFAIWKTFLANPAEVEVYMLTCQIFHAISSGHEHPGGQFHRDMHGSLDATTANLQSDNGLVQDHSLHLVCMLLSIGCNLLMVQNLVKSAASQSPLFVEKLQSTLCIGSSQEVNKENNWLAIFRLQVLPWYKPTSNTDPQFSGYLASWFKASADPSWDSKFPKGSFSHHQLSGEQCCTYWTYLGHLCNLMNSRNAQEWCKELREHGHLACISGLLQYNDEDDRFQGVPLVLYALLCLSRQENSQDTHSQFSSLVLTKELVEMVAHAIVERQMMTLAISPYLLAYGGGLNPHVERETAEASLKAQVGKNLGEMLEWLFSYLKAAKDGGLLDQGLANSVVKGYTGWCKGYVDDCQEEGLALETSQFLELPLQLQGALMENVSE